MEHREEWLAHTFVELADTLVADFDLIDFLTVLGRAVRGVAGLGRSGSGTGGHPR